NAGIAGPTASIENVSLDDWRQCLSVNLDGSFLAAKLATPIMKNQKNGVITLTSSTAGQWGYPYRSPYATAKWGIIGLMKTLA
ncbi:MAG: SDR family NAD(P)-dependent oxidoreductase, partial [Candidatus Puniceispirillales bacterium]